MKKPLISIIVAIYNGEKFLNKCIDSIINQDYKNLEIILVNDGSTDNSKNICLDYKKKDSRIIFLEHKNHGVCFSRNVGLDNAKGEYVAIIDQDDWIEYNYISYLYDLLTKNNCQVATIPQVIISSEKHEIYNEKSKKEFDVLSGEKASLEMLYGNFEIGPWNKLVSRKLLLKNKIQFHEELFGGEGFVYSVECFLHSNKVAIGYKGIYHYRIDNYNSEMSKFRMRTAISSLKAVDIMKNELANKSVELRKAILFAKWNVYNVYLFIMIASGEQKKYKNEFNHWRKYLKTNIHVMNSAPIQKKRKIKSFLIIYFPKIYMFVRKIKIIILKSKVRDFNKTEN